MKKLVLLLFLACLSSLPCSSQETSNSAQDTSKLDSQQDVIFEDQFDATFQDVPDNAETEPQKTVQPEQAEQDDEKDAITLDSKDIDAENNGHSILFRMYAQKIKIDEPEGQTSDKTYDLSNGGRLKLDIEQNSANYLTDTDKMFKTADITYDSKNNNEINYNINLQANNSYGMDSLTTSKLYSYLYTDINPQNRLYIGQSMISDSTVGDLAFIQQQEYRDNVGAKITGKAQHFDYEAGVYGSSETDSVASGLVASSKSITIVPKAGSVRFGSAYYSQGKSDDSQDTYGLFGEYKLKGFKLKSEIARNKYVNSNNYTDNVFITPELSLTKNLSIKTKYSKDVASDSYINDFILNYSLKGKKNWKISNINLELDASYVKQPTADNYQVFKFLTKYDF